MSAHPLLDAVLNTEVPKQLFHYTSAEGVHGITTTATVRASVIHYLNDSHEFTLALQLARHYLTNKAAQLGESAMADLLQFYAANLRRIEQRSVCVFSLSEEGDMLSQWRGYCPPRGGYAISFPVDKLKALLAGQGAFLAPCVYDGSQQRALIEEALSPFTGTDQVLALASSGNDVKTFGELWLGTIFSRLSPVASLVKHHSFCEEKEWRIVWTPDGTANPYQVRVARGMFIPYVPLNVEEGGKIVRCDYVVGPMPQQYIAVNGLTTFFYVHSIPWQSVSPSRTTYRDW